MAGVKRTRLVVIAVVTVLVLVAVWALLFGGAFNRPAGKSDLAKAPAAVSVASGAADSVNAPAEEVANPDVEKPAPDATNAGATLAGTVVDKLGRPMERMSIGAVPAEGPKENAIRGAKTDTDGAFRLRGLPAGTYDLTFRRPRYEDQPAGRYTVSANETIADLRLVYPGEDIHFISGTVTNGSGEPIPNAAVNADNGRNEGVRNTHTDENGAYRFNDLLEGTYHILVSHHDYTYLVSDPVQADTTNVNFTLTGRGSIEGRVINARTGQPVTTYQIGASSSPFNLNRPGERGRLSIVTDPQGNFHLDNAEAVDNYVVAAAEGLVTTQQVVQHVREGATVSGVLIRMEPGATIEGRVVDKDGQPISKAWIYLGNPPAGPPPNDVESAAVSDEDGRFQIASVAPDVSKVSAVHSDYVSGVAPISVTFGETTQVTIELSRGGTVEGHVTVAGKPVAGQTVSVDSLEGVYRSASAQTDGNGKYSIERVPEGTVRVFALIRQKDSSHSARRQAIVAKGEVTTVDFALAGGTATVEGFVTKDGKPVTGATIGVSVAGPSGIVEGFGGQADKRGHYRLEGVVVGDAVLRASYQTPDKGIRFRSALVDVSDGQVTRHDVEFTGGAAIAGTVSWENAAYQPNVAVFRGDLQIDSVDHDFWWDNEQVYIGGGVVQPDGTFHMDEIEPGEYTVLAFAGVSGTPQNVPNTRIATEHVQVADGGEVSVNLTLP